MWTCCECENHYDSNTGDTEERMCHKCLDAQYEGWMEASKRNKEENEIKRVSPNTTKGLLIDIYDLELYRTGDKNCRICALISELFKEKNIMHLLDDSPERILNVPNKKEKNAKKSIKPN